MVNALYSDKYLTHIQEIPPNEKDTVCHIWKKGETPLAQVQIDLKGRKVSLISLNTDERYHALLPRLVKCLAKTLWTVFKGKEGMTLPFLNALINPQLPPEVQKKILLKWIKNGGDPNAIISKDSQGSQSLVMFCTHDCELIACLLDHGLDPQRVRFMQLVDGKPVVLTWTLAYMAAADGRLDILKLLHDKNRALNTPVDITESLPLEARETHSADRIILTPFQIALSTDNQKLAAFILEKEKIDLNASLFSEHSLLTVVAQQGLIASCQFLLEKGARFLPGETLPHVMGAVKAEKKRALVELLVSFLPLSAFERIEDLELPDLALFLEVFAIKNKTSPPSIEEVKKLKKHSQFFKHLGHKFGIPLTLDLDFGLPSPLKCSTEGDVQNTNQFAENIYESATAFFKEYPQLSSPTLSSLLTDFCNTQEMTLERATECIEKFQKGSPVFVEGRWPKHYVSILLYQDSLIVCNRGGWREAEVEAGISFYQFEDRRKLTPAFLLSVHKFPSQIIEPEKRKQLGLAENPITLWVTREQPGGFCSWDNRKLGFRLLLALATALEKGESKSLRKYYEKTKWIYQLWSKFDRDYTLTQVLAFYEQNPTLKPLSCLLLFILANYKGEEREALHSFLLKQNFKPFDFLTHDSNWQNLFHHLCRKKNAQALVELIKHNCPVSAREICKLLLKQKCQEGRSPLYNAVLSGKHKVAIELISWNLHLDPSELFCIFESICHAPSWVSAYRQAGIRFAARDSYQLTGLHYAIENKSSELVTYFIKEMSPLFFITSGDLRHYIQFAQEKDNLPAADLLQNLC